MSVREKYDWANCFDEPLRTAQYIDSLHAEIDSLKQDAEIGKLVRSKLVSGNSVPVSRCHINKSEVEAIDEAME